MVSASRILRLSLVLLLVAIAALLLLQMWYLAHIVVWREVNPSSTRFMRIQLAELQAKNPAAVLKHRWVDYDQISPHLKRAVIASEDARFADHDGVDWAAIEEAFERNRARGVRAFGGSTITMQLAKNLFLTGERSYVRKVQEVIITYMLEVVLDKRRILELYLNVAEWGVGVFGADAAARHHYGVSAGQLSPAQAARMAAMLPRPRHFDLQRDSPQLQRRAASVRRWMQDVQLP